MIVEASNPAYNKDWFKQFSSTFRRFADSAPVFFDIILKPPVTCILHNRVNDQSKTFTFDYNIPVSETIFQIKQWLFDNWYPALVEVSTASRPLTSKEVLQRARNGDEPLDSLMSERVTETTSKRWVIDKVIVDSNLVMVTDSDNRDIQRVYRFRVPSVNFLRRIMRHELSPEDAWTELNEPSIATFEYTYDRKNPPGRRLNEEPAV